MGIAYGPPQQLSNSSLKEVAWNKLEPPDVNCLADAEYCGSCRTMTFGEREVRHDKKLMELALPASLLNNYDYAEP